MVIHAQPSSLEEAVGLLSGEHDWTLLAGGTDVYPSLGERPVRGPIMDINRLAGLRGICREDGYWAIGGLTTWTDVVRAELPPAFCALQQAAREVGSVQIQNRATVAGNLCNASPAADGIPPLLVMNAEVELSSVRGLRRVPLHKFILGNRRTDRKRDEILIRIRIPETSVSGRSSFVKLGARRYLVISIAMIAARLHVGDDGTVRDAAVAIGSCSEVACRLSGLENELRGTAAGDAAGLVNAQHMQALVPIDDIRATARYRRHGAQEGVRRAIRACLGDNT